MTKLYVDIETYATVDLKVVGAYRYVQDPEFDILMGAFAYDDDPVAVLTGDAFHELKKDLLDPRLLKVAHNAAFERICFSQEYNGGRYLDPRAFKDTMALAGVHGYPQKLEKLAPALGVSPKDTAGTALINFWCKPDRNGNRRRPEDHPEKWLDFVMYCEQDVTTLREVEQVLPDFPTEMERRIFLADQRINDHGMKVDVPMARKAVQVARANAALQIREIQDITGIDNPNSNPQMLKWLQGSGLAVSNLQAETVSNLLEGDLSNEQRRVLELRQELALVASKKFQAALAGVCRDGRLRGQFRYFGAHTGRWTGRGIQPQNLPREGFKSDLPKASPEPEHHARAEHLVDSAILDLMLGLGADALTLKRLVRPLFVGPFSVVDYAAIEARAIAWEADEGWALEAFRAGRDIYVETANRMSTPGNKLDRSQGKVAVLALGYNGAVDSLRAMGASGTDRALKRLVYQWRRANPKIVQLWADLDEAFYRGGQAGPHLYVEKRDDDRLLWLPSGRAITYHHVKFQFGNRGRRATFWSPGGYRTDTYGGRLAENATQAIARDLLGEALVRLLESGYDVAGHVHDEVLAEHDNHEEIGRIMTQVPEWAGGFPIDGAGFVAKRYRKD